MTDGNFRDSVLPQVLDLTIRLGLIFGLLYWSYNILHPFSSLIIGGIILAVACYPGYQILREQLNGRGKLAASVICGLLLLIIVIPSWFLGDSLWAGIQAVRTTWEEGNLELPAPTEQVKAWPIIGERVFEVWTGAHGDIQKALVPLAPHISTVSKALFGALAGASVALLQFIGAVIVAGLLLVNTELCAETASRLSARLDSRRGIGFLRDAEVTVRNVARGIIGVAVIEAILVGIGLSVAGIPGAGLWAMLGLILCVVQIGLAPISILATIYLYATASTFTATVFLFWSIILGLLDNVLKPIILGKGAPVPMIVIFLGSLGGFLDSGIMGLFVGAVILSLAYKLLISWISSSEKDLSFD